MNIKARREELERISIDNRFILERIQRTTANFDRHTLDKAAKLQEKYVMQMSAFANGRRGNDKSKFVPIKPMKQPRPQSAMPSTKAGSEVSPSGGTGAAGSSSNYLSYGNGAAGKGVSAVRAAASLRPSSAPVSSSHPQIFNSTAPPGSLQMDQLQLQLFRQQQQLLGSLQLAGAGGVGGGGSFGSGGLALGGFSGQPFSFSSALANFGPNGSISSLGGAPLPPQPGTGTSLYPQAPLPYASYSAGAGFNSSSLLSSSPFGDNYLSSSSQNAPAVSSSYDALRAANNRFGVSSNSNVGGGGSNGSLLYAQPLSTSVHATPQPPPLTQPSSAFNSSSAAVSSSSTSSSSSSSFNNVIHEKPIGNTGFLTDKMGQNISSSNSNSSFSSTSAFGNASSASVSTSSQSASTSRADAPQISSIYNSNNINPTSHSEESSGPNNVSVLPDASSSSSSAVSGGSSSRPTSARLMRPESAKGRRPGSGRPDSAGGSRPSSSSSSSSSAISIQEEASSASTSSPPGSSNVANAVSANDAASEVSGGGDTSRPSRPTRPESARPGSGRPSTAASGSGGGGSVSESNNEGADGSNSATLSRPWSSSRRVQFREASAAAAAAMVAADAANAASSTAAGAETNTSITVDSVIVPPITPVGAILADTADVSDNVTEGITSVTIPPQPEDRNPPSENFDLADDSFIKEDPAGDDADSIGPDHHESWSAAKGEGEDTYDDKEDF